MINYITIHQRSIMIIIYTCAHKYLLNHIGVVILKVGVPTPPITNPENKINVDFCLICGYTLRNVTDNNNLLTQFTMLPISDAIIIAID